MSAEFEQVPGPEKELELTEENLAKAGIMLNGDSGAEPEAKTEESSIEVNVKTIDDADRQEFLRCILGNAPYKREYKLFNGQVTVKFRTRTVLENEWTLEQAAKLSLQGIDEETHARLAKSLVSTSINGKDVINPEVTDITTWGYFNNFNEILFYAIKDAFDEFESLCGKLYDRSSDPDFW